MSTVVLAFGIFTFEFVLFYKQIIKSFPVVTLFLLSALSVILLRDERIFLVTTVVVLIYLSLKNTKTALPDGHWIKGLPLFVWIFLMVLFFPALLSISNFTMFLYLALFVLMETGIYYSLTRSQKLKGLIPLNYFLFVLMYILSQIILLTSISLALFSSNFTAVYAQFFAGILWGALLASIISVGKITLLCRFRGHTESVQTQLKQCFAGKNVSRPDASFGLWEVVFNIILFVLVYLAKIPEYLLLGTILVDLFVTFLVYSRPIKTSA
jgi:hypothetical protein